MFVVNCEWWENLQAAKWRAIIAIDWFYFFPYPFQPVAFSINYSVEDNRINMLFFLIRPAITPSANTLLYCLHLIAILVGLPVKHLEVFQIRFQLCSLFFSSLEQHLFDIANPICCVRMPLTVQFSSPPSCPALMNNLISSNNTM